MSTRTKDWLEAVQVCLRDCEVEALTPAVVLALIEVESSGNPYARKQNVRYSQFWGLLQMGELAGVDVGMERDGRDTTKPLNGNGIAAIEAFVTYVERYQARAPSPDMVAVLWKGGPGTASDVLELVDSGASLDEAIKKKAQDIPRLDVYVERFRRWHEHWQSKLDVA